MAFEFYNYPKSSYQKVSLVKMKIMQAAFFENRFLVDISWTEKIKKTFTCLFMAPAQHTYNFSE